MGIKFPIATTPKRELTLFDSTCIIVGIIIGAGIYETAPTVAAGVGGSWGVMLIWLVGGLLSLAGALCYAELASAYPRDGGDYIYLNRAYGRWAGFSFGWVRMVLVYPVDIALMAFVFSRYAQKIWMPLENGGVYYAGGAVLVLTVINLVGVRGGKWTQNVLTVIKALGLLSIVAAACFAPAVEDASGASVDIKLEGFQLSLILVLFTFGGWQEMAYVAGEVRRPERNIARALLMGTATVTVLYLLVNGAFLLALGYPKMVQSEAVAVDTVSTVFQQEAAGRLVSILVCISALGAMNGLTFTGARVSYALGAEHRVFRGLGQWSERRGTPLWALALQGSLSLLVIVCAGSFVDTIIYNAPMIWLFFLATGLSVMVLRRREPHVPRPYRVIGYPVTPILFCLCCVFMLYSSIAYAMSQKPVALLVAAAVLLAGVPIYGFTRKWN